MTGREFTDEHKANISAAKMGHPVSDKRSVRCIETGKIFPFMKDAMAWAKISRHLLLKACPDENYIAGGYHWQYAD